MKAIKSPTDLSRKEVEYIITTSTYTKHLSTLNSLKVVWWFYFDFEKARYFALKIKYGMLCRLAFEATVKNFNQLRGK